MTVDEAIKIAEEKLKEFSMVKVYFTYSTEYLCGCTHCKGHRDIRRDYKVFLVADHIKSLGTYEGLDIIKVNSYVKSVAKRIYDPETDTYSVEYTGSGSDEHDIIYDDFEINKPTS